MPKPRLRHVIYFFGALAILLSVKKPICAIRPEDWWWPFLILFAILLPLELYFMISPSYRIKGYLDKGDAERFLKETLKEMAASPAGLWREFYKVNSTAGLYYLGRFEEALAVLDEVQPQKLRHRTYIILYYNNKLANLLGAERVDEASKLAEEQAEFLRPNAHNRKFYFALQGNLAVLKYYQGQLDVARHMLEESLQAHNLPLPSAVGHYYLGRIARDQGRNEDAERHFARARELGRDSFVIGRLDRPL